MFAGNQSSEMKNAIYISIITLALAGLGLAQKSNDVIAKQIKSLKADKAITLSYDAGSNATKIMVTGDNFAANEAKAAGIQAMNFGMAFFYVGKELVAPPETINFTFWVLTKEPKFAASHGWSSNVAGNAIDLGDARYVAKSGDNLEYLNFRISRDNLKRIVDAGTAKFRLGAAEFTFTPTQIDTLKAIFAISESH